MYEIREGFGDYLEEIATFDTREAAMQKYESLGEYKGTKCSWFAESNCSGWGRIPDDYTVAVFRVKYEDGDFEDEDEVASVTYGYDQMMEEYGSKENAPFGMRMKDMQKLGW